jgi:hypothetical protein
MGELLWLMIHILIDYVLYLAYLFIASISPKHAYMKRCNVTSFSMKTMIVNRHFKLKVPIIWTNNTVVYLHAVPTGFHFIRFARGTHYKISVCKIDIKKIFMIFQVVTRAQLKITVLWGVALCSLVEMYQCFEGTYCFHHQGGLMIKIVNSYYNSYQTTRRNVQEDNNTEENTSET